ncbi:MAG: 16S rRNA (cytosine967-C5)-methyltransferase [Gammaproteobacteria bacterium]|jgi:16S rRNA (cytosine967-C5)-methyltransferase
MAKPPSNTGPKAGPDTDSDTDSAVQSDSPPAEPAIGNPRGARDSAREALLAVLGYRRSLSSALPHQLDFLKAANDKAFAHTLTLGVLRHLTRLEAILNAMMDRPLRPRDIEVQVCLLIGVYQLAYLGTPAHAAVSETVNLLPRHHPWARGLTNAVLRRFARDQEQVLKRVDNDETSRLSHPAWLLEELRCAWPTDYQAIAAHNNQPAPLFVRVNPARCTRDEYLTHLQDAGLGAAPFIHSTHGLVLEETRDPRRLPGYDLGWFSVQDGAAQLAATVLAPKGEERILDACAAPGGKTAHLLEIAPNIRLTAVEQDADRGERLVENLKRLGHSPQLVIDDAAKPERWWDSEPYDRILLDAPCSATGTIRRHPDIKVLRQHRDIANNVKSQRRLLKALWPLLAPGGQLLYATCSVLHEENELQIATFLDEHADATAMNIEAKWGRLSGSGRQVLPGDDQMDGFFYALLSKSH